MGFLGSAPLTDEEFEKSRIKHARQTSDGQPHQGPHTANPKPTETIVSQGKFCASVEEAIKDEIKGEEFYTALSKKKVLLKGLFLAIAHDEHKHRKALEEIHRAHCKIKP
jgi:hypothetical protein